MTTNLKGILYGYARGDDWLTGGNDNFYRGSLMANEQWGPRAAAFSGLTYAYFGGAAWNGTAWTEVADGTIALTDNATNYVERNAAGTVTKNTTAFTASAIPMAKVTTASGLITAIAERRREQVPSAGGGAGALVLLEQHTASSSASLDFTSFISSTYDAYMFDFVGINPATNAAQFYMRMGTGGGPTYDSGSNYDSAFVYVHVNGSSDTGSHGGNGVTAISFFTDGASGALKSTNPPALTGTARLYDPQNASAFKVMQHDCMIAYSGSTDWYRCMGGGVYRSNTALTAVQFLMSTGNIASGTIRAYGIAKT